MAGVANRDPSTTLVGQPISPGSDEWHVTSFLSSWSTARFPDCSLVFANVAAMPPMILPAVRSSKPGMSVLDAPGIATALHVDTALGEPFEAIP